MSLAMQLNIKPFKKSMPLSALGWRLIILFQEMSRIDPSSAIFLRCKEITLRHKMNVADVRWEILFASALIVAFLLVPEFDQEIQMVHM